LALVLQILLAVLLIAGLVTAALAFTRWHWGLALIALFLFLSGVVYLYLAAETIRIHRNLRAGLANLERQVEDFQERNYNFLHGDGTDAPGIVQLTHQLQMKTRERGRAWRQVAPAGQLDNQGRREVTIPSPTPHGLQADTIVYVFEAGKPNPADPAAGQQYLGEFRVVESKETGVVLEAANVLDNRTGERLARSQGPWNLYESMPVDRYSTFAGMDEAELRGRLPESIVEEYLHHGQEATPADDPRNVVGFDENDQRLPFGELNNAVRKVYQRPLRDYAYLFSELIKDKIVLMARIDAVREDNAKLEAALASAEKLSGFREEQKELMKSDLAGMQQDRKAIEGHLQALRQQLENARKLVEDLLAANSALATELAERESALREMIDAIAPTPATASIVP
jgi:cell fate (sporulation/competence/biofilm development) regulator YlbF (YheA/YmcA/DUF963 family)